MADTKPPNSNADYTRVNVITNAKSSTSISDVGVGHYGILLLPTEERTMDLRLNKEVKIYTDDPAKYEEEV